MIFKNGHLLFFTAFAMSLVNPVNALTHTVYPGYVTSRINTIISKTSPGDTILFKQGHYIINNILVLNPVVLIGEKYPVLDGNNKNQILSIGCDKVTVKGFKFINTGFSGMNEISAVRIQNAGNINITGNILENVFFGIYCLNANSCYIGNNRIHSVSVHELQSGNGIHCWKSDSMHIYNNNISGQRDGIYFEFVTNSVIQKNVSHENLRYGLHFMFSHHNSYLSNKFDNNGAGVAVMYSHNVTMVNNIFTDNKGQSSYGILMKDISDSYVKGNQFLNNTIGIYMEGTSRINVRSNIFRSNGWAFKLQASCSDILIERNEFIGNTFDVATNGSLVLNKFSNNYWDKYEGYDLNRDGIGDVPYRPVSLFSIIAERMPYSIMLYRCFMVMLLERTEKAVPGLTPVDLKDDKPFMKASSL
ncbi:MAG: nitrous oxide reductase family maturation protein NosD [Bacteroidota bacterium]